MALSIILQAVACKRSITLVDLVVFDRHSYEADAYNLGFKHSGITYERIQLVNNRLSWCYKGVLHEFIHCNDGNKKTQHLPWTMVYMVDGQRHSTPSTYQNDAKILEKALVTETDPFMRARYTFYLGQSWRDCGEQEKALEAYLERSKLGFWDEEVYMSLLNAGRLRLQLQQPAKETLEIFARASIVCPHRAEAFHDSARLLRTLDRFDEGYVLASTAQRIADKIPAHGLFVENWIYKYGFRDELSVLAYHAKHYETSLKVSIDLLSQDELPSAYRERIAANAHFALGKVAS